MRRTIPEQEKNRFVKIDEMTEKDQWRWIPRVFGLRIMEQTLRQLR
jgi:hypothetical protein